jgi:AbrB family looped-hinge helix DNA binding protein
METTIDMAGRVVIPKAVRQDAGLVPGTMVEIFADGTGVRIEPIIKSGFVRRDGRLVIASSGQRITDEDVRDLRLSAQR